MATKPSQTALAELGAQALRNRDRRIEPVEIEGARYWIKRRERLEWRRRLEKGNPRRLFARELALHKALIARGAPVAPIVLAGPEHVITADCGPTLHVLAQQGDAAAPAAFEAAGRALAALHGMGIAHGRPKPDDICYDPAAGRITFIDLERGTRFDANARHMLRDLKLFAYVHLANSPPATEQPLLAAFAAGYRQDAPPGMWETALNWARGRGRWLGAVTAPLCWHERRFKPGRRVRRYCAIPEVLAFYAGLGEGQ